MPFLNIVYFFLLALTLAQAAPKPQNNQLKNATSRTTLDTNQIHKKYVDGDFDEAIDKLESALKYTSPLSHEDSVFIFKHLGVMYTAKYETREKGKQYMLRLLEVEPTARLMDMYASDMIYMIFKNLQDEYELAKAKLNRKQELDEDNSKMEIGEKGKSGKNSAKSDKQSNHKWVPWTVAALAATGGVVLAVTLLEDDAPGKKENVVDWNAKP